MKIGILVLACVVLAVAAAFFVRPRHECPNCRGAAPLAEALAMPEWLREIEAENLGRVFAGDEEKLRFAIRLAEENVRRGTGGPFGAAIFSLADERLIAVGREKGGEIY